MISLKDEGVRYKFKILILMESQGGQSASSGLA